MDYFIEQKISTLADNAVDETRSPSFELDGITYRQWQYGDDGSWLGDAWTAEGMVEAVSGGEAIMLFQNKLVKAVPIIALISECFTEFKRQPYLVKRSDLDFGYLNYTHDSEYVGLMFMEEQLAGLRTLFASGAIRGEFYKYWNDAVNTIGYSPKLLLMFSALEALAKKPNGNTDWSLLDSILGTDLKEKMFARNTGLRHRLVHGEYLNPADASDDYVRTIHRKVIGYINGVVGSDVISTDTIDPQRHFFGNKLAGSAFLRPNSNDAELRLREVVADFEANDHQPTKYDYVSDDNLTKDY